MGGILQRIKDWWAMADRTQRMIAIGGGAFMVLLILGTVMLAGRPKLVMLFGGLSTTDESMVVTELQKLNYPIEFDQSGNVMISTDKAAEARMKLAAAGKLPSTTAFGDSELAGIGIMNTPSVERERLKTILENRLSNTIESIDEINHAQVHLVLGDDSPFIREAKPATASITVTEKAGGAINKEQAKTVAMLVANSVPGLTMANVAVLNSKMEMLFDGSDVNSSDGHISSKLATEQSEGRRRERELQGVLDTAYGAGTTIAKVNCEYDFDDRQYEENKNTPSDKMEKMKTTETMDGSAPPVGGASGLSGNSGAPAALDPSKNSTKKYSMETKENTYAIDTKHTEVKESAGSLKSMAIDVIVNSDKITDPQPIQDIVDGYLGPKSTMPGFTRKVTMVKFDTSSQKLIADAASAGASQQRIQQIISILPIAAMIGVALMVMKSLGKVGKPAQVMVASADGTMVPFNPSEVQGLPSAAESTKPIDRDAVTASIVQSVAFAAEEEDEMSLSSIKSITKKVNVPLEQIKRMSDERPEAVAMLIKGWLLEERK